MYLFITVQCEGVGNSLDNLKITQQRMRPPAFKSVECLNDMVTFKLSNIISKSASKCSQKYL